MNNVAEFIKIRVEIESYAKELSALLEQKMMPQSRLMLDRATVLLAELAKMVDNDVQVRAVTRLTGLLNGLGTKVTVLERKKQSVKKSRSAG